MVALNTGKSAACHLLLKWNGAANERASRGRHGPPRLLEAAQRPPGHYDERYYRERRHRGRRIRAVADGKR